MRTVPFTRGSGRKIYSREQVKAFKSGRTVQYMKDNGQIAKPTALVGSSPLMAISMRASGRMTCRTVLARSNSFKDPYTKVSG